MRLAFLPTEGGVDVSDEIVLNKRQLGVQLGCPCSRGLSMHFCRLEQVTMHQAHLMGPIAISPV